MPSLQDRVWGHLLLLVLIPGLCALLYLAAQAVDFHNLPPQDPAGLYFAANASQVANRAVVFSSYAGPVSKVESFTVRFAEVSRSCELTLTEPYPRGRHRPIGLLLDRAAYCYPEAVARKAKALGFHLILLEGVFHEPGWAAISLWKSNDAPIPIYELPHDAQFGPHWNGEYLDLYPTPNAFKSSGTKAAMIVVCICNVVLGLTQISTAIDRIRGHFSCSHFRNFHVRTYVCCIQVVSGLFRSRFDKYSQYVLMISLVAINAVDPAQLFHIYNFPVFRLSLSIRFSLLFLTIYLVASAYSVVLATAESLGGPTRYSIWLKVSGVFIAFFVLFEMVSGIFNSIFFPLNGYDLLIAAINVVVVQIFTGAYFFVMKRSIVRHFKESNREFIGSPTRRDRIEKMSAYLYSAAVPMLLLVFTVVVYFILYSYRYVQILPLFVASMLGAITEIMLVASFTTGQQRFFITDKENACQMLLKFFSSNPDIVLRASLIQSEEIVAAQATL